MAKIETWLTRLETRLKGIFESEVARDGIPRALHGQLLQGLLRAMRAGAKHYPGRINRHDQENTAPDRYTLILPPAQAQLLLSHPAELDNLALKLEAEAGRKGMRMAASPLLRIVADPQASDVMVYCSQDWDETGDSSTLVLEGSATTDRGQPVLDLPNAFLIVNGLTTFHLKQAVINIGSGQDSQLVLAETGVSRLHAQLRYHNGHFVIFDLDSQAGTMVNGVIISNHVLRPGDVIMLGRVPLVYGEETGAAHGYTQELPAEPPPPEVL